MQTPRFHPSDSWSQSTTRWIMLAALTLLLAPGMRVQAQDPPGSNARPLAFGPDQTIIDLTMLVWAPLPLEGAPPGPEIAVLRGDPKVRGLEAVVRLPARYTFDLHLHAMPTPNP
jgi:hypothetical protein